MHELIFATTNRAKLAQMAYVIEATRAPIQLISARERFGEEAAYDEQGETAATVALIGAMQLAARLGVAVLVEDTTFHVLALDGKPGTQAGRFLKEHGRQAIIDALDGADSRTALIVSAACWANPHGDTQTWMNVLRGTVARKEEWLEDMPEWIAPTPDNPLGGGYNPIFIPARQKRTLAQIPPDEALVLGYREPNFSAALSFVRAQAATKSKAGKGKTKS